MRVDIKYRLQVPRNIWEPLSQGKTRERYPTKTKGLIAIIASDRISTHNVVHLSEIPLKGEILTYLTIYWLTEIFSHANHHLVAYGRKIYDYLPNSLDQYRDLHYRTLVVKDLDIIPVEFIFRQYLTGSLYQAYMAGEDPYDLDLPPGLYKMHRFDEPVFTPTDKSESDDPLLGWKTQDKYPAASQLKNIFKRARAELEKCNIALVDTKFEVGYDPSNPWTMLADEILTPDSSRFVIMSEIKEGEEPPWLDKQPVRLAAELQWGDGPRYELDFDRSVVEETTSRYQRILQLITGRSVKEWRAQLDAV